MLAKLRERFQVLTGAWGVLDHINLSEIPDAYTTSKRSLELAKACDWDNRDQVGEFVDSVFVAAKEDADVTRTEIDDQIVEATDAAYRPNRELVIDSVIWLRTSGNADPDPTASLQTFAAERNVATGESGKSVTLWIEIAALVWKLVRPFIQR